MVDKEKVKNALMKTEREGMKELLEYMEQSTFFVSPGSTKYHGNYEGGLLDHCTNLYTLFWSMCNKHNLKVGKDTMLICAFCHDLCKAGAYIIDGKIIRWNKNHPKGHAVLSLERTQKFIKLSDDEIGIIRYHMGPYGTTDFYPYGEYTLSDLTDYWNKNKLSKLFYFCDDTVATFRDKKV